MLADNIAGVNNDDKIDENNIEEEEENVAETEPNNPNPSE
jgi:hypothetical protein